MYSLFPIQDIFITLWTIFRPAVNSGIHWSMLQNLEVHVPNGTLTTCKWSPAPTTHFWVHVPSGTLRTREWPPTRKIISHVYIINMYISYMCTPCIFSIYIFPTYIWDPYWLSRLEAPYWLFPWGARNKLMKGIFLVASCGGLGEVATLQHELGDDAVEHGVLVAQRLGTLASTYENPNFFIYIYILSVIG